MNSSLSASRDQTSIALALRIVFPDAAPDAISALAELAGAVLAGALTPAEARASLAGVYRDNLLSAIGSQPGPNLIRIGEGGQLGDVTIGEAAGRDIVKLTVNLIQPSPTALEATAARALPPLPATLPTPGSGSSGRPPPERTLI